MTGRVEAGIGEGRPVAAGDISGKKICWNNGNEVFYMANGHFTSWGGDHGTWSIPEPGLIHVGYIYRQTEVLPDGRLHIYWYHNHGQDRWGTVCN